MNRFIPLTLLTWLAFPHAREDGSTTWEDAGLLAPLGSFAEAANLKRWPQDMQTRLRGKYTDSGYNNSLGVFAKAT